MLTIKALLLSASISIAASLSAQEPSAPPEDSTATSETASPPEKVIEGDTPDRVAQVESCQGQKFETRVEIDPVTKRTTRIKLCGNPGASDADWVKTLEAAVVQIEQRDMPPEARQKLIDELREEIAKFAATTSKPAPPAQGLAGFNTDPGAATSPSGVTERFETSVLPPLPAPKSGRTASAAISAQPPSPMRIAMTCLDRGQSGAGGTCGFLDSNTIFAIQAVEGLEAGGKLRFRRRGEIRGDVVLAPLQVGQSIRVKLPAELCRGVTNSKVEIELLNPSSTATVAARLGPYYLRC